MNLGKSGKNMQMTMDVKKPLPVWPLAQTWTRDFSNWKQAMIDQLFSLLSYLPWNGIVSLLGTAILDKISCAIMFFSNEFN